MYSTAPHTHPLHTAVLGAVQSIQTFMSVIDHSRLTFDQNITTQPESTHYCQSNLTEGSDAKAILWRNAFLLSK